MAALLQTGIILHFFIFSQFWQFKGPHSWGFPFLLLTFWVSKISFCYFGSTKGTPHNSFHFPFQAQPHIILVFFVLVTFILLGFPVPLVFIAFIWSHTSVFQPQAAFPWMGAFLGFPLAYFPQSFSLFCCNVTYLVSLLLIVPFSVL